MRDFVDIGGAPYNEGCASIGERFPCGSELNRLECRCYILALRRFYGTEPEGASLVITRNPHEFGTYYEVRCRYDTDNEAATAYAFKVENGLRLWAEGRMSAPVVYTDDNQPKTIRTKAGDVPFRENEIANASPEACCWPEDALATTAPA